MSTIPLSPTSIGSDSTHGKLYDLDIQDYETLENEDVDESNIRKSKIYMLYQKKDIFLVFLTLISTFLSALPPAISSILMGRVFNVLSNYAKSEYDSYGEYMHKITLSSMSLIALGGGCIGIVWTFITCWMLIGERHGARARKLLLNTFLKKEVAWYDSNDQIMGDLTQWNRCVEELRAGNSEATALVLQDFLSILALLGTSFYYSWSITLVMIASTPLVIVLSFVFARLIERFTLLENNETAKAAKVFDWSLTSAKMVRLFKTQDKELAKFTKSIELCKKAFIKLAFVTGLNLGTLRGIMLCMFVQGFWFGSSQVRKGHASVGNVLTCFSACLMIGESFRSMLPQIVTIQKAKVAIEKLQGFIQTRNKLIKKNKYNKNFNAEDLQRILLCPHHCQGDIKIKNVEFSYSIRKETKVLKNVSLHFPKGELTFVVGSSGSGKSTLSNLLLNFYKPTKGRVEIDGFNVHDVSRDWLTDNITLVEQTCTLFDDSIKNNILMGSRNPFDSEEKIDEALQMSLLNEVIRDLPEGIDTLIGNNGSQLSGGQQQRVVLARARIRDTPILILDEPVSALDIVLRELIIEAVKTWRKGKTTIILTHELSQIGKDDYVYLMENGEVKENGLRYELEAQNGKFRQLLSLQETTVEKIHQGLELRTTEHASNFNNYNILSANLASTFNAFSYFEFEDLPMNRAPIRRSKRAKLDLEKKETEERKKESEDKVNDRPDLTPIKRIIRKMFATVQKKPILFTGITFSVLSGVVNPIFSYCFSKLLSGIMPQKDSDVGSSSYNLKWSLIVLCLAAADGITTFFKSFLLDYSSEIWIFALRKRAFEKISKQSISWFGSNNNNSSELNTLIMNDSRDLRCLVSHFLSVLSTAIILASLGLIWAFVKGWKLSLVCLSLVPLFMLTTGIYASMLQDSENKYKNAVANLEIQLYEIVQGIKTIKTLRLDDYFVRKFEEKMAVLFKISVKRAIITGMGVSIITWLTYTIQGILLYYGMKLVGKGDYKVSQLMETFVLLVFSIMSCAELMSQIPDISRGQRAGSYIFKILESEEAMNENSGDIYLSDISQDEVLRFHKVNFSYVTSQKVLKNVSFRVQRNEHIAIIGESGSGKSTLTLLMTRLFATSPKSVFFQGIDINNIETGSLRSHISLVDQKATFFDGTIFENLTYGLENITEHEVLESIKMVSLDNFLESLPNGLHSRIDTSLISGGQAQRLSIARAILKKPKLLILDECTSALDSENSYKISQLVKQRFQHLTIVMITHTEEMMKVADRIITMKNGEIVEQGSYNDLFQLRGEFYRIVTAGM